MALAKGAVLQYGHGIAANNRFYGLRAFNGDVNFAAELVVISLAVLGA